MVYRILSTVSVLYRSLLFIHSIVNVLHLLIPNFYFLGPLPSPLPLSNHSLFPVRPLLPVGTHGCPLEISRFFLRAAALWPQVWTTSVLFVYGSVSLRRWVHLCRALGTTSKWYHMVLGSSLFLAYYYDNLWAHPWCCKRYYSILFQGWVVFHCIYLSHFCYQMDTLYMSTELHLLLPCSYPASMRRLFITVHVEPLFFSLHDFIQTLFQHCHLKDVSVHTPCCFGVSAVKAALLSGQCVAGVNTIRLPPPF